MTTTDYNCFIPDPNNLTRLLTQATADEMNTLIDFITDSGKGRVSLDDDVCKQLIHAKASGDYGLDVVHTIRREIGLFGGNTIANTYRKVQAAVGGRAGSGVEYQEVVRDIGKHVKANFPKDADVIQIERAVVDKVGTDIFNKMSPEEREQLLKELGVSGTHMAGQSFVGMLIAAGRAGGFSTYRYFQKYVQMILKFLLGHGVRVPVLSRVLSTFLGPVGIAATSIWTLYDLASPAYRVTLPCILQIASIRIRIMEEEDSTQCSQCEAVNALAAKFCATCGSPMASEEEQTVPA